MDINLKRGTVNSVNRGDLFLLFSEEQTKKLRATPKTLFETEIASKITEQQFSGKDSQKATLHLDNIRLHILGIGEEKKLNKEKIRKAAGSMANHALCMKIKDFQISSDVPKISSSHSIEAVTEGLLLGEYRFDKYKTENKKDTIKLKTATLLTESKEKNLESLIKQASIICNATNYTRDLQTENADVANPLFLEKQAREIARKHKLKLNVLDEKKLKKMGANLILAVGSGSKYPPRIIFLHYKGNPKSKESTAILGKGITFDTGGINLKPTGFIETMKTDMSGAAAVLGIMKAAAALKLKKNIVGVVSTAENAIGSTSYKPGDVFKSLSGKTVEIGNTDAEGRLVLADALTYTEKNIKPSKMIDLATLTGAVIVALGDYTAGIYGTDSEMINNLKSSGDYTYERVWELPLHEEYIKEVKSDIADFNNINYPKKAGSIMGAAFLSKFVEKTPWAHIDIAGTSWLDNARDYYQKGATGFGVRLIIDYLKNN
jgi:leucyl aminopeptidase